MNQLDEYERKLLESWEEVFKKGQLTLWIMLSLMDGPKHMAEIRAFIAQATASTLTADDQSIYRALRRYFDTEMVDFTTEPGDSGPDRKVYRLTKIGDKVLAAFVQRNIVAIWYQPMVQRLIQKGASHVK